MTESGESEFVETTVGRAMLNKLIVDSIEGKEVVMT